MKIKRKLVSLVIASGIVCTFCAAIASATGNDCDSIPADEAEPTLYDDGETVISGFGEIYSVEPLTREADYYWLPNDEAETAIIDGELLYDDGETVIYGSGEIYSVEPVTGEADYYWISNDDIETVSPYSYDYAGNFQAARSVSDTAVLGAAYGIETYNWSVLKNNVAISTRMFSLNQYDSVQFTFTANTNHYYDVNIGLYDHDNGKFVPYQSFSGASGGKETAGSFTTTTAGNFSFAIRCNSSTADTFLSCSGAYSW